MIASTSSSGRTPDGPSPSPIYTLEPLLAEGQAALALHPADTISGATLTATMVVTVPFSAHESLPSLTYAFLRLLTLSCTSFPKTKNLIQQPAVAVLSP